MLKHRLDTNLFQHTKLISRLGYSKSFSLTLGYLLIIISGSSSTDNGLSYMEQHWLDQIWGEERLRSYEANHGPIQTSRTPEEVRRQLDSATITDLAQSFRLQSEYTKLLLEKKRKYIEGRPEREREKIRKIQEEYKRREKELAEQLDRDYSYRAREEKRRAEEEEERQNDRMIAGFVGVAVFAVIALVCKCHFWKRREKASEQGPSTQTQNASRLASLSAQNLRLNIEVPVPLSPSSTSDLNRRTMTQNEIQPSAPPSNAIDEDKGNEDDDAPPRYEDVVQGTPEVFRNRSHKISG